MAVYFQFSALWNMLLSAPESVFMSLKRASQEKNKTSALMPGPEAHWVGVSGRGGKLCQALQGYVFWSSNPNEERTFTTNQDVF